MGNLQLTEKQEAARQALLNADKAHKIIDVYYEHLRPMLDDEGEKFLFYHALDIMKKLANNEALEQIINKANGQKMHI